MTDEPRRVQTRFVGLETIPEDARPDAQRRAERWIAGEIARQGHRLVGRLAWTQRGHVIGLVRGIMPGTGRGGDTCSTG